MYENNAMVAYDLKKNQIIQFQLIEDMLYCNLFQIGIKNLIIDSNLGFLLEDGKRLVFNDDNDEFDFNYAFNEEVLPRMLDKGLLTYNTAIAEKYNLDKNYAYDKGFKKRVLSNKK